MDAYTWNEIISNLPNTHLLQTWEWGQFKARYGWKPFHEVWRDELGKVVAAALILQRTIPIAGMAARVCMLYVPKGPLLADWEDAALRQRVLTDLRRFAQERRAFFIKIDSDVQLGTGVPGEPDAEDNPTGKEILGELKKTGWLFSKEQIQFRNTVMLDLQASEEEMLARMKQKTRYNIRLAKRKGVQVREGGPEDFSMLYYMFAETAVRDEFVIRHQGYYDDLWNAFYQAGKLKPIIAEVEGDPVAALMLFIFAGRAWYLTGMSRSVHREKMPNYLLQWEAMRAAKGAGCSVYDLWGAPDEFVETDALWGVYRFKRGLGGTVERHLGAWDLPIRPWLYRLYTQILPKVLGIMRGRGRANTKQDIQGGI
ncbi:MAG: peptidoglycan bridge formation glycyltransferase FemA/FemB family protein [Chloroflexi bacterium]|nr:peptidoglycan bridge formation glycyltransferase FemA/FemB family protein [Chloroflexota bacterium]